MNTFTSTRARDSEKIANLRTDDTTAAALSDHLLRCMLITQKCAASIDGHQTVKVVDGRCAPFSVWLLDTQSHDPLSRIDRPIAVPAFATI
jgi:hypothetical protein